MSARDRVHPSWIESALNLWAGYVPDGIRKPAEFALQASTAGMLGVLLAINEKVAEFGALGYAAGGLFLIGLFFWVAYAYAAWRGRKTDAQSATDAPRVPAAAPSETAQPDNLLPSLPAAIDTRMVTLEAWFQGHERRIAAATQRGDAQQEEVDGLRAQVAEFERVATGCLELARGQGDSLEQMQVRLNKLDAVTNELRKTATGRSFEIDIDKMIARLTKLMSPNAVHEQCGGDEGVYLKAVEEFANDLLECSKPWPRTGWLPYEGTLDRASNDTAKELAEMGDEVRLTANEMERLRKRTFARHLLDGTAAFLEAHRKEAVARQRDFIDTPFRT